MPVLKIKKNGFWVEVWGATSYLPEYGQTVLIVDENNNQIPAVVVEDRTVFDATPEDIKLGKVAASDSGIVTGTHVCE